MQLIELEQKSSKEDLRLKIVALEAEMKKDTVNAIHIEPKHYFANGLYAREITIPKGVLLTGMIHKTEHLCVLSKGKVSVYTDDGMKTIEASTVVHSSPGIKRVLFAHEDSVWINFHHNPTNETDIDKIEKTYVVETFDDFYLSSDRSFYDVLKVCGVNENQMKQISDNLDDFQDMKQPGIYLKDSPVHGKGLFASKSFNIDDEIGIARLGKFRTPIGKFCNHSGTPNAKMVMKENGNVELVAIDNIKDNEEIFSDYYFNFKNTRSLKTLEDT